MHTNKRTSSRGSERRKTPKVLRSPFATFLFLKDGIEEQYCREQTIYQFPQSAKTWYELGRGLHNLVSFRFTRRQDPGFDYECDLNLLTLSSF